MDEALKHDKSVEATESAPDTRGLDVAQEPRSSSSMLKATAVAFAFGLPLTRVAQAQGPQTDDSPTPGDPGDSADASLCDSDPVDNPDVTKDSGVPDNGTVGDGGPGDGGPGPGTGHGDYGYW